MGMIHAITFATEDMSISAERCTSSARRHGADLAWRITPQDIRPRAFYRENQRLLDQPRGWGYWAWKPYIILDAMNRENYDYIVYADAGIEFINDFHHIIDQMDQDIFLFGNQWEHAHWCKRDIVDEVWPTNRIEAGMFHRILPIKERVKVSPEDAWEEATWARFGKQAQASVIFLRVNDRTRAFVKEWLDWCLFEGGRLIDDSPSRAPNHPEFRENRHDQAILTTMAYRDGLRLHWWPAMYNDGAFTYQQGPEYKDDLYPIMFHHHRRRNHEWKEAAHESKSH